jgi:hypothetical protein
LATCAAGCSSDPETKPSGPGGGGTDVGSTTSSTGGQGGAGGEGGACGQGGQGGSAACAVEANGAVLAVNKLFLGDTNPDGTPNTVNGWKQYGFNVDGLVSTDMSMDLCKPKQGAPPSKVYPDGNNGIDNSFGKNVMPLFSSLAPNFSENVNQRILAGDFTLIAHLADLGPEPDKPSLLTRIYGGGDLGEAPKFDGTDCWPVLAESLMDPADIKSAKISFDMSSVAGNVWSSGGSSTLELILPASALGVSVKLTIHQARFSMVLDPSHGGAMGGQIGGVLDTEEFATEMKNVIAAFDPSFCSGPTSDSLLNQIRQASDIMKDGTQDPAQECDGISIGLGFTMTQIGLAGVAPPVPPTPPICPP